MIIYGAISWLAMGLLVFSLIYMGGNAISGEVEERCKNLAELKSIESYKYMDFKCYHKLDGECVEVGVW